MPWCPVCKNEYREGIARCADCNVALIESLDEEIGDVGDAQQKQEKLERLQRMYAAERGSRLEGAEAMPEAEEIPAYHPYQNSAAGG